jgi:hypothetical protein
MLERIYQSVDTAAICDGPIPNPAQLQLDPAHY